MDLPEQKSLVWVLGLRNLDKSLNFMVGVGGGGFPRDLVIITDLIEEKDEDKNETQIHIHVA